eukprot:6381313-Pyramimonas_sp.AAC.1
MPRPLPPSRQDAASELVLHRLVDRVRQRCDRPLHVGFPPVPLLVNGDDLPVALQYRLLRDVVVALVAVLLEELAAVSRDVLA